jgi:alcohol dehydrogenase class IV
MSEIFRPAFEGRLSPYVSYNTAFHETCARHAKEYFHASRIYIIASSSLAKNTRAVEQLKDALGDHVVGSRDGMKQHTYLSEVLEISREVSALKADLIVTLGAGSLTDGAKIVVLVST